VEKTTSTDCIRNEVLHIVKVEKNIIETIKRNKANWIGHTSHRNCLLKHVTVDTIQVTGRQGRRRKQLLAYLKEMRRYCKLKNKTPDHTLWTAHFLRGYGPVLGETMK
jgi:hypothetical protein